MRVRWSIGDSVMTRRREFARDNSERQRRTLLLFARAIRRRPRAKRAAANCNSCKCFITKTHIRAGDVKFFESMKQERVEEQFETKAQEH